MQTFYQLIRLMVLSMILVMILSCTCKKYIYIYIIHNKQEILKKKNFLPINFGVWCPHDKLQSHDANNLNPDISIRFLAWSFNKSTKVIRLKQITEYYNQGNS